MLQHFEGTVWVYVRIELPEFLQFLLIFLIFTSVSTFSFAWANSERHHSCTCFCSRYMYLASYVQESKYLEGAVEVCHKSNTGFELFYFTNFHPWTVLRPAFLRLMYSWKLKNEILSNAITYRIWHVSKDYVLL